MRSDAGADAGARSGAAAGDAGDADASAWPEGLDLQELLEAGIDAYLGVAEPVGSEVIAGDDEVVAGSIVYDFDPADGPVCLRGGAFHMSVLDQGSDDLLIYLRGGGACFSLLCSASETAEPRGVPKRGVMDVDDPDNPVAGWNIVYVPYCDGSVFGGDAEIEGAEVRIHHGQRNFAAALDRAVEHFPAPRRVLLAGSSAGGWGTIYHQALVRSVYPNAELSVMNDAGVGLAVNLAFIRNEWNASRYQPASCADCQTSAHLTPFQRYLLEHDAEVRVGVFSSWEDSVIERFTFAGSPENFRVLLGEQTAIPADAFPERYKRFFIEGTQHTALLGGYHTTMVDGVPLSRWLGWMIDRDPVWEEALE